MLTRISARDSRFLLLDCHIGIKRSLCSPGGGGGRGIHPRILDRDVPRRFVNPNPI